MPRDVTSPEAIERQERRVQALELRLRGLTYPEIGRLLKISHKTAREDVMRILDARLDAVRGSITRIRALEDARLDAMQHVAWDIMLDPEATKAERLAAIDRGLRIQERRAKLFGLDAPQRIDITSEEILSTPHWQAIREAIARGLKGYPEASASVTEQMRALGQGAVPRLVEVIDMEDSDEET